MSDATSEFESLSEKVGWAVHSITTSITHKLATPTSLDADCLVLGRVITARLWVEVDPEHNPGWVMGPGDEAPWFLSGYNGAALLTST
jgi:hypothetical protein